MAENIKRITAQSRNRTWVFHILLAILFHPPELVFEIGSPGISTRKVQKGGCVDRYANRTSLFVEQEAWKTGLYGGVVPLGQGTYLRPPLRSGRVDVILLVLSSSLRKCRRKKFGRSKFARQPCCYPVPGWASQAEGGCESSAVLQILLLLLPLSSPSFPRRLLQPSSSTRLPILQLQTTNFTRTSFKAASSRATTTCLHR